MLQKLRTGAKSIVVKIFLFGLLLLAMAGLALTDVQGMFRSGVARNSVAEVGGKQIALQDFDRRVRAALQQMRLDPSESDLGLRIAYQVLQRDIQEHLLRLAARDSGIIVSDALAARQIRELIQPLVGSGMDEKQALERLLQIQSMTEQELVRTIKTQIASDQMLGAIMAGIAVPQQLVRDIHALQAEEREGRFIKILPEDAGATPTPDEAQLTSFYKAIEEDFKIPEYRKIALVTVNAESLKPETVLDDARLEQAYQEQIADYTLPEQRKIAQALLPDEEQAQKVFAAAKSGKGLKAAVAEIAGSADSYLDPELYTQDGLPAEMADAAFALEKGGVSAPVSTAFGWHVLQVMDIVPPSTTPFEKVKDAIRKQLLATEMSERVYTAATQIEDAVAGGQTLAEAAQPLGLAVEELPPVSAQGRNKSGGEEAALRARTDAQKILAAAFSASVLAGETAPMVETSDGSIVFASVLEIFPASVPALADVKAEVTRRWQEKERVKMTRKLAAVLAERVRKGETLEDVAKGLGKSVRSSDRQKRDSNPADLKEGGLLQALFQMKTVGEVGNFPTSGGELVLQLDAIHDAAPTLASNGANDALITAITESLERSLREDTIEQFHRSLLEKYPVTISDSTLQRLYGRSADNGTDGSAGNGGDNASGGG